MDSLFAALSKSMSPLTTSEERQRVDRYLTDLTRSRDSIGPLMNVLKTDLSAPQFISTLTPSEACNVRLLVVTLVSLWVQEHWNKLSCDEQLELRGGVLYLFRSTLNPQSSMAVAGSKALAIKLSVLIGNIAELQYPQHWPTFVGDMLEYWTDPSSSPLQRMAVISAIECVATDCIDSDFSSKLPSHRIQDILEAFKIEMAPVLQTAYSCSVACVQTQQLELARAVLKMLVPVFSFLKVNDVFAHGGIYFTDIIVHSLSVSEIQAEAAQCLHAISRFNYKDHREVLLMVMKSLASATIGKLSEDLEESLAFQRTYAEAVFSIFSENFSSITAEAFLVNEGAQDFVVRYVTVMAGLIAQPSRRLACDVGKVWVKVFKDDSVVALPWMGAVSYRVLCEYLCKIKKPPDGAVDDVTDVEFDDKEDMSEFFNTFRALVRQLASQIAVRYPKVAVQFLIESLPIMISKFGMIDATRVDVSVGLEWDSYYVFFDAIMTKFPVPDNTFELDLKTIVNALLVWRPQNDISLVYRLRHVQACAPIFIVYNDALFYALQVLFESLKSDVCSRQKTATLIAYFCEKNVTTIVQSPWLSQLVDQLTTFLENRDNILNVQSRTPLVGAIVTVATHLPEAADQQKYLYLALKDIIGHLTSSEVASIIVSPPAILQASIESLSLLRTAVGDIFSVAKRIQAPVLPDDVWTATRGYSLNNSFSFITVWDACLPTIIRALLSINGMWEPSFRAQVEWTGGGAFFEPSSHDVGMVRNPNSDKFAKAPSSSNKKEDENVQKSKAYVSEIRTFLLQILGQASQHKVLYMHCEHRQLVTELSKSLPYMENHHYLLVLKFFVESYAINAPPVVFSDASEFIGAFLSHSTVRLKHCWNIYLPDISERDALLNRLYRYTAIAVTQGRSQEDAELARERVATDMGRSLCDLMSCLVCFKGPLAIRAATSTTQKKQKDKSNTSNGQGSGWAVSDDIWHNGPDVSKLKIIEKENDDERIRLIRKRALDSLMLGGYEVVTSSFVLCVATTLALPDSICFERSLRLSHLFVDKCSEDSRFVDPVGSLLFKTAVDILLRQEEYLRGNEWNVTDFMMRVYMQLVLPEVSGHVSGDGSRPNRGGQMHGADAWTDMVAMSQHPRKVLLSIPGASVERIMALEMNLCLKSKEKWRKDIFRDFFIETIKTAGIKNSQNRTLMGPTDTVFSASTVSQQTVRVKDIKKGCAMKPPQEEIDANLNDIFSDI